MSTDNASTAPVHAVVHTPGPWGIDDSKSPVVIRPGDDETAAIAIVFGQFCEDGQANALLIAAAPDLLAALEHALQWIESDEVTHGRKFGAGNIAREAIAKATGVAIESEVL